MSFKDNAGTIMFGALGVWIAYKFIANRMPGSFSEAVNKYYTSVITDSNGNIDLAATVGMANPSDVATGAYAGEYTAQDVEVMKLANQYGVRLVWDFDLIGDGRSFDAKYTIRDVAYAAGVLPVYTFFGGIDVAGTLSRLYSLYTVTR